MKKFVFSILTTLILSISLIGFASCNKKNEKSSALQTPVYQGMSIAKNEAVSKAVNTAVSFARTNAEQDFEHENESELEEDIEDIVQIEVKGDETTKYYVQPNEVFTVQIHIDNPNDYEIQSFTLNDSKYANYMFKDNSTMELLLLDVTAPSTAGYLELTIDAIKYIDGTEIKDVKLDGEKTIKAGVAFTQPPTASLSNVVVSTTSVSFGAQITDTQNVIDDNEIKAYLSNGAEIVAEKEIEVGANNVTFDNLLMGTTYEIGIATSYDYIDGYGVKIHWLLTETVATQKAFMITGANVGQESVAFTVEKLGYVGDLTKIELIDGATNATVQTLTDATLRSFDSLLSNHPYKIALHFAYENNGAQINDTSVISFTTKAKTVPTVTLNNLTSTQTSVGFEIATTDIDGILSIDKIELYKGSNLVKTAESVSVREFTGLLSNNEYTVKVSYSYDLNDGVGTQIKSVQSNKKTLAKTAPTVTLNNLTSTQTSVGFEIATTDIDGILSIDKIELYKGSNLVKTAESVSVREFTGLLSNNEYTVKVSYSYDLNDGVGKQIKSVEGNKKTLAKTAPTIAVTNDNVTDTTVKGTLSITDIDDICTINSVKIYKGETAVATNEQKKVDFSGLEYYTDYKVVVNYSYDLNDGVGVQTKEFIKEYKTAPYLMFNNCNIINTSAVSEGDTIYMQVSLENPSGALPQSVIVNGQAYNCTGSTTATKIYVEIVNEGQFAGGDTTLIIEQVNMTLGGKTYSVLADENNRDNVFINGKLEVVSLDLVNADGEIVDYCFPDDEMYLLLTLNNKTGYTIDSVKLSKNGYNAETIINLIKVDDERYKIAQTLENGWNDYYLTEISYSNTYINKTLGVAKEISAYKVKTSTVTEISSVNDLMNTTYDGGYYKLTADIDLSGIEWTNLGDFYGVFDGNGYSINNMSNVSTVVDKNIGIGLFAEANGIFQNLTLKNVLVMVTIKTTTGTTYDFSFGGIICDSSSFKIKNCHAEVNLNVKNTTNGAIYVGGLAGGYGYGYNNIIIEKSSVNINAVIGGALGFENCYIGGLVTHPNEGLIVNSFTEGNIVVDVDNAFDECVYLGGLCARTSYDTQIVNSYSSCDIELSDNAWNSAVGGLLGFGSSEGSTISNSYYVGTISIVNDGYSYACDGLIAAFGEKAKINNCYSFYASSFCVEKTLEELTSVEFQTTILGWSTDDWIFVEGQHPKLKWQN